MDRKRIGRPYASANAPPKKALKPLFADDQINGRVTKLQPNGRNAEFIFNNFVGENVHTAIVGDSIFDSVCIRNCVTYSLSGGRIEQFHLLLDTLSVYRNVILAVGGNNLSNWGEPGEDPSVVVDKLRSLYNAIRGLENCPKVIVCSVLKRNCSYWNIQRFNAVLRHSQLPFFKLHQEVCKSNLFLSDGVHLNLKGRKALACAMNKVVREHQLH